MDSRAGSALCLCGCLCLGRALGLLKDFSFERHRRTFHRFRDALLVVLQGGLRISVTHLCLGVLSIRFLSKVCRARPPEREKVQTRDAGLFRGWLEHSVPIIILAYRMQAGRPAATRSRK